MMMYSSPPFAPVVKADEPCGGYFGNLCTGFGDSDQTCWGCGWQRFEHPSEQMIEIRLGSGTRDI